MIIRKTVKTFFGNFEELTLSVYKCVFPNCEYETNKENSFHSHLLSKHQLGQLARTDIIKNMIKEELKKET